MYRFISSKPIRDVNKAYLALYDCDYINEKFENAIIDCPELVGLFPAGTKGAYLLIYSFPKLVELYYGYH